jgi:hypothetical protein
MYEQNNDLATGYIMGRDSTNNGYGNGMFGDWSWWIIILLIFGWGNGGYGFGGNNGGGNVLGYELGKVATTNDVASGFNNSAVLSSLNDIKLGQQQAINYNNQGFSGLNTALLQGFHGVDNAVCTLGYQQAQGFNSIGHAIDSCCCTTQRSIDGLKYEMSKGFCDVIRSGVDNTRQILDYLTGEKIASLQSEVGTLKSELSNNRQSAYLLNELKPCPIPAYITCNPNAPYGLGYGVGFNQGCGCGCN